MENGNGKYDMCVSLLTLDTLSVLLVLIEMVSLMTLMSNDQSFVVYYERTLEWLTFNVKVIIYYGQFVSFKYVMTRKG